MRRLFNACSWGHLGWLKYGILFSMCVSLIFSARSFVRSFALLKKIHVFRYPSPIRLDEEISAPGFR